MLGPQSQFLSLSFLSDVYKHTLCGDISKCPRRKDVVLGRLNSQLSKETGELRKMTLLCGCIFI